MSVACHNNYRTCALILVPPDHVTCSHSSSSLARDQRHQKTFAEYPAPEVAPGPSLDLVVGAEVSGAALHKGL